MNQKEVNLFTEGPIGGSLIRFALPVLGALILQAAYGAVDLLVARQFGDATGISAVGTGNTFMQMITFVLRRYKLPISFSLRQCRIYGNELKKILNVGVPIALQEATVQVSFLVITTIVNQMGLMQSTGYGVSQKIVSFIMLVPSATMQSVSAFVAQNIGAGQRERAKKGLFTAMIAGCSLGVVIFLGGFFGGGLLSSLFTNDAAVIAKSASYLRGFSADCILTCILFGNIGYFNGCGKSIPVMLQGITSAFLIRIPVSVFMSRLPGASLMMVGFATPITTIYGILFFAVYFARLRKK